ncbi:MAG TPA: hypothetical protein P5164_11830, partial [Thermoanaerobaculia bacterium]|nr:hypothetical protein [Thermoanaerobaculia bacterium]
MAPLVLLQSSDWHVGSPLTGRGLGLGEELRALRRREVDEAPERLLRAAPQSLRKGVIVNLLSPNPYLFWMTVGAPAMRRRKRPSRRSNS